MMTGKAERAAKYDALARGYSCRYSNAEAVAGRQVELVTRWGRAVERDASVLELGCADGFATAGLAGAGLRVTAVDLSPGMIGEAAATLRRAGCVADLMVGDVNALDLALDLDGEHDVTVALMWTFFSYASDPARALRSLAARTRTKLLVDVNPRQTPLATAIALVRQAGFDDVRWRPFLVPQRYRLGRSALRLLRAAEVVPVLRGLPLRYRFVAVVKGERRTH